MDVELRYIAACPSLTVIRQRLALALDAVGHCNTDVRLRLVRTAEEAQHLGFVGSPTVLVDGIDPFPESAAAVGLSCRLYRDGATVSGSPSVEQLTAALAERLRARQEPSI
ncbi:thioredoxin family protein (plasmid) [Mycolicibacterium crocinum]|uniref:Thioredoxin family protein n=1 Tax=Mycolicibacterium crocinum TaxID=388459 RepID=A0ABY3TTZ6_9MYCO|nr:thioredoxin family protein [Mycolicibacterium crocinum]ULN44835.1 thioredoxin family protein [Mycolicibacterium crocinum]